MAGPPPIPPEVFPNITWRPAEQILGYLPNLFSLVIEVQGGHKIRLDDVRYEMVERPTDVIATDQRVIGYKFESVESGLWGHKTTFKPRFGADLEKIQEVRVKDNRTEVMGELTAMGYCTLYVIFGGSREAEGMAQWIMDARERRRGALGLPPSGGPGTGGVPQPQHDRWAAGGWGAPPPPS